MQAYPPTPQYMCMYVCMNTVRCVDPRTISREGALGLLHNGPLTPRAATAEDAAAPPPVRPVRPWMGVFFRKWRSSEVLSGRGARRARGDIHEGASLASRRGRRMAGHHCCRRGALGPGFCFAFKLACPLCCQQPGPAAKRAGRRRSPQRLRALPVSRSGSPGGRPTLAREGSLRSSLI
jgi:hypothetical protein